MKKTLLVLCAMFVSASLMAQTDYLRIVYDASKGKGGVDGASGLTDGGLADAGPSKVYMHSGAANWSKQPAGQSWGADNGVGEMTNTEDDLWVIEIHWSSYYGMNPEAPAEMNKIGMVFRNEDGTLKGADNDGQDVFLAGLGSPAPYAENKSGTLFDGVTAEWIEGFTGINEFSSTHSLQAVPTAISNTAQITYTADNENIALKVYNMNGQLVDVIEQGFRAAGEYTVTWTPALPAGRYIYVLEGAKGARTEKFVIVH